MSYIFGYVLSAVDALFELLFVIMALLLVAVHIYSIIAVVVASGSVVVRDVVKEDDMLLAYPSTHRQSQERPD